MDLLSRLNPESSFLVRSIGRLAEEQGMRAYLVGGPVRDLLLKSSNTDLDITVEGSGIRLARAFGAAFGGSKVTVYPAFKTATVLLPDGRLVDFATARQETYARGGAFPAVKPAGIRQDLLRRDFTINAMAVAIGPKTWGKITDPYGGAGDLKAKRIRVLHDHSFLDDPTRILRAARFKARLGFKMEAKTLRLLKSAVAMKVLDTIRPQRYLKDFNKILKEPTSLEAIGCLKEWDAFKAPA
ncbi:MAG: CCA tRNA nucleotidyltransferase [Candidatus Omnitrophica bacterium]|nr:CCA tRNA nucleotidyltransferase [Candidatus Omnitrophota bacterium]MDE2009806.1 CCA tRNA nucleotidyltransferase [Candidatus Omnitrophota bacterium]MDE2215393.1 CCA tRNA nucleotidyltransferase [Candidatus Omnitrophota bacterium]MDE2231505.1 CCA tRNA nucleotidyltransferase [Candidatus Omnitrophota bacterium]